MNLHSFLWCLVENMQDIERLSLPLVRRWLSEGTSELTDFTDARGKPRVVVFELSVLQVLTHSYLRSLRALRSSQKAPMNIRINFLSSTMSEHPRGVPSPCNHSCHWHSPATWCVWSHSRRLEMTAIWSASPTEKSFLLKNCWQGTFRSEQPKKQRIHQSSLLGLLHLGRPPHQRSQAWGRPQGATLQRARSQSCVVSLRSVSGQLPKYADN